MPVCIILACQIAASVTSTKPEHRCKVLSALLAVTLVLSLAFISVNWRYYVMSIVSSTDEEVHSHRSINITETLVASKNHVAYIKTHKTGGSTIFGLVMEYALTHNLTLALPASRKGNKLGWPQHFTKRYATPGKPDVLCYHSRYSDEMVSYMPKDTSYITILREPANQLNSAYTYFNAQKCFRLTFDQFVSCNRKHDYFVGRCQAFSWWLKNGQMFDLGMTVSNQTTTEEVMSYIHMLDSRFKLVLILELLDQSLIALRDMLGWETDDVVYLKKNFYIKKHENSKTNESWKREARKWNWADSLLYDHFYAKLQRIIATDSLYYKKEVAKLRRRTDLWFKKCVKSTVPANSVRNKYLRPYSPNTGSYVLTDRGKYLDKCVRLAMPERTVVRFVNSGTPVTTRIFKQGELNRQLPSLPQENLKIVQV